MFVECFQDISHKNNVWLETEKRDTKSRSLIKSDLESKYQTRLQALVTSSISRCFSSKLFLEFWQEKPQTSPKEIKWKFPEFFWLNVKICLIKNQNSSKKFEYFLSKKISIHVEFFHWNSKTFLRKMSTKFPNLSSKKISFLVVINLYNRCIIAEIFFDIVVKTFAQLRTATTTFATPKQAGKV